MYIWSDNFEVANKLVEYLNDGSILQPGLKEGLARTIVNKSYYACFHKVKENNDRFELKSNKGGSNSHVDVIENILNYPIENTRRDLVSIINDLKQLKEYRRQADYDSSVSYNIEKAEQVLILARETFKKLETY